MMRRRTFLKAAAAAAALPAPSLAQGNAARSLRFVPASDLASLDPIWTTAPSTKNHGYLVYDQITAVDSHFKPQPQMAEGWTVEDDGRAYVFTLRAGLRFHDGEPVRALDCVASIRRWGARDGFGQALAAATDALEPLDDRRFRFRLKKRFPLLPAALGKSSSSQCFIMPERLAKTDPFQQVSDPTGSGPFRFLKDEWVTGARAAYAKFEGYLPRPEPVDGIAGGRVARVDRIEWTIIPDPATASAAMMAGEQDYWEQPLPDLVPVLRRNRDLVVEPRYFGGTYLMLRFNQLQPPFDNPALRRAVAMAVDQADYMRAIAGADPTGWGTCRSFFACGTPLGEETAGDLLKSPSLERARAAVRAAGYAGERVVVLGARDFNSVNATTQVTVDLLGKLGFNVDYVSADWGTVVQRRTSKEPVERGGWSIFHTPWNAVDILDPAVNQTLRSSGKTAWFGWPDDPALEQLRQAWFDAADDGARKAIADQIQLRAFDSLPYVPLGFYRQLHAWRRNLTGVFPCPCLLLWNIAKTV